MTKWGLGLETLRKRWDPGGTDPDRNSIGELCRRAGIERSEYFRICHKSKFGPSVSKVVNLLQAMGYSWTDWAIALEGSGHIKADAKAKVTVVKEAGHDRPTLEDLAMIPLLEFKVAIGGGAVHERERMFEELAFQQSWIKNKLRANPSALRLVKVSGDSMEPTICDVDLVLFDTSQKTITKSDQLYVVRDKNDGFSIKRLRARGGLIEISSDNPATKYQRQPVKAEQIQILGKVVWMAGRRT